jgi:glutathionylspermidine synthase
MDGNARLRSSPCIVPSRRMKALRTAALAACRAYDELCDIVARDPSHLTDFFSLTPVQKILWYASGSLWHGIARADIFCTTDGSLAIAEINSDTPSGVDEAFLLGEFAAPRFPGFLNPNSRLREAFLSVINGAYGGLRSPSSVPTIALAYPTDIPEDQGMLMLYQEWLEEAGFRVLTGSPSNLEKGESGRAEMFGTEIDVLFRHYKTDWWCERVNVWKDARGIPDAQPLAGELASVLGPMVEGRLAVVNPFGAVITQNKLSLAFFHEKMDLFSSPSQETIRRYIPVTKRLSVCEGKTLEREKDDWVLKSDYGCEGAEVIVGRLTGEEAWSEALRLAEPAHWVVQRYFQAERLDSGLTENYGVYVAGGEPAGLYVRLAGGVTANTAVVVPALERPMLPGGSARGETSHGEPSRCDEKVRSLIRAYTPSDRWLPFRMSLILHSAANAEIPFPFEETPSASAAAETGEAIAEMFERAPAEIQKSTLIIADLDGVESVALGARIAPGADVVLQIENLAHEREFVPLRATLGALLHFAPLVAENAPRDGAGRTAAIILDRRRLGPLNSSAEKFNNRHWAYMPSVRALEDLGITTILYVHPDGEPTESDDLNEDFVQYSGSDIRICYASPLTIRSFRQGGIAELLDRTAIKPARRETVFSYMLPRGDEGRIYLYNQETDDR